jgi:hypothetical protein
MPSNPWNRSRLATPMPRVTTAAIARGSGRADGTPVVAAAGTRVPTRWATAALIGVNLFPLVGVAFLGWSTFDLMLLYWFENGVVALYVALTMLLTEGPDGSLRGSRGLLGRLLMIGVFAVGYAAYWSAHGNAVVALFGDGGGARDGFRSLEFDGPVFYGSGWSIAATYLTGPLLAGAAGLLASHGAAFVSTIVRRGEDLRIAPITLFLRPYPRVVLLQVALGVGGFLVLRIGEPLAALLVFVLLKTGFEVAAQLGVGSGGPRGGGAPSSRSR